MADLQALIADIDGIKTEDNEKIVQQKSRDFYWYSPVLKERLDACHRRSRRFAEDRGRADPRAQGLLQA
jgi:hypothetical protein